MKHDTVPHRSVAKAVGSPQQLQIEGRNEQHILRVIAYFAAGLLCT
jgi:hypothetical protein